MKESYDFSNAIKNPYISKLKKQITIRLDYDTVEYFKDLSVVKSDPTSHAELDLIRTFCQEKNIFSLEGYTLYSSSESCVMCSGAIHWAKIKQVVFSVSQQRFDERHIFLKSHK